MGTLILKRCVLTVAVVIAPYGLAGCGDGGGTTTIPANTPPIPTDEKGKPLPPPTAAQPTPGQK
jgi:hypothetical protein